jgi:hypothetical protein
VQQQFDTCCVERGLEIHATDLNAGRQGATNALLGTTSRYGIRIGIAEEDPDGDAFGPAWPR